MKEIIWICLYIIDFQSEPSTSRTHLEKEKRKKANIFIDLHPDRELEESLQKSRVSMTETDSDDVMKMVRLYYD